MKTIFDKLLFISNLSKLNQNSKNCENIFNKFNVNKIENYLMKMFKISVECNAFDVNEDKQRQCYKQLKCFWPKCRYSCKIVGDLNKHISHHLNKRQFVCEECNKYFNCNSNLLYHKRRVHLTDRPFACNGINCNKTFKTKSNLVQHKRRHSSVKSFGCDNCDRRFVLYAGLTRHKKFVHSHFRPFVCPRSDCNKIFKRKLSLIHHNLTHSSVKSFGCNKRDKRFKTKESLDRHKPRHSSDKPFECEKCNQRYKYKSLFMSHKLIHSEDKPFKCDVNGCDKRFQQKCYLNRHRYRIHSGIKRYKCFHNNCDKSFVTSHELKRHTMVSLTYIQQIDRIQTIPEESIQLCSCVQ